MTTGVVAAARGQGLEPSNAVNELLNPKFINDNYPVGITYPNVEAGMTYKQNFNTETFLAGWRHAGPIYPNGDATSTSYFTTLSNVWLYSWQDYGLVPFLGGYIPRVLKLFGVSSLFAAGNTNPATNNLQADRQNSSTGGATGLPKITSNTTLSSIPTGSTSMDTTAIWVRSADWVANVFPDDTETHVKFGAQVKIDANDQLRLNNFAGMYIYEDVAGAGGVAERRVTTVIFKDASSTYVLPTGTLTLPMAQYNWNGVDSQDYGTPSQNFFAGGITTILNQYELDQDDYGDFTKVTYYHELKAGTNRTVSMSLFFAENAKYMYDEDVINTGAIQIYDPFIEYAAPPVTSGPVATITSKQNLPSGSETTDPQGLTFNTSTDGSGSGATLTCTASTFDSGMEVYTVDQFTLNAGGTGYQVGDNLEMLLGPHFGSNPSCTVATIS